MCIHVLLNITYVSCHTQKQVQTDVERCEFAAIPTGTGILYKYILVHKCCSTYSWKDYGMLGTCVHLCTCTIMINVIYAGTLCAIRELGVDGYVLLLQTLGFVPGVFWSQQLAYITNILNAGRATPEIAPSTVQSLLGSLPDNLPRGTVCACPSIAPFATPCPDRYQPSKSPCAAEDTP